MQVLCVTAVRTLLIAGLSLFIVLPAAATREDTLSYFQYATPVELDPVSSPQLAELIFTEQMHDTLRYDQADLRIVQSSNQGVIPVQILKRESSLGDVNARVSYAFTRLEKIPVDLEKSYAGSCILLFQVGRSPLSHIRLSSDIEGFSSGYLLLGQSSTHLAGSGWRLLARGVLPLADEKNGYQPLCIAFDETSCSQYAVILDRADAEGHCTIEGVSGPRYRVCFQVAPGESYTLLSGYPEASSVVGYDTSAIDQLIRKGEKPVSAWVGDLLENPAWQHRGLKALFKDKMFALPVAVVVALVLVLLVFVMIYGFVNRHKSVKIQSRPRFPLE